MQRLLFGLGSVLVVEEVCLEYVQRVDEGVLTTEAIMEPVTVHEVVAIAYGRGEVGSPLVLGLQQREETLREAAIIDCPYSYQRRFQNVPTCGERWLYASFSNRYMSRAHRRAWPQFRVVVRYRAHST